MADYIGLRKLKVDQKAVIRSVRAQGDLGRRIREMGLIPGTEIAVTGRAPLRDPVALRLNGFTLTLRNNEADHISVEVLDND
ncbi:FeoA family protein [Paucidesulfovibrio longus]|uniref:FeoA family protein n=1 Tax=Paucidesulfovibrio longus TaxID=889 RepID=UPI0003B63364|nr:FeoA family protein [Paucidesulfovibrio longus]